MKIIGIILLVISANIFFTRRNQQQVTPTLLV